MTDFNLRSGNPDDASAMAQLWLEATSEVARHEPIYMPNLSHSELTGRLRIELETGSKKAYVAYAGSELAAYATFRVESESPIFAPRTYLYVIDLDVSAKFRQQGLSKLLMAEVESYAKTSSIKRIELAVIFEDPRAKAVWEHHGFKTHILLMHKEI
jgi:GNAT superfamily N-acetyltransferase